MPMSDSTYAITLFLIMISAGVLGGFASYHLSESEDKTIVRSVTLGVVAAFIVPVFLSMISSNLLVEAQKNIGDLYILLGFCVLSAVFSRNFLENIYNKVLQQVGNIGEKVKEIEEASIEPDVLSTNVSPDTLKEHNLTENEYKLLTVFSSGKFNYRSITGLVKDSGMDKQHVDASLNTLLAKSLVLSRFSNKTEQMRYFLSGEGRHLLGELSLSDQ